MELKPIINRIFYCMFMKQVINLIFIKTNFSVKESITDNVIFVMYFHFHFVNKNDNVVIGKCTPPGYTFLNHVNEPRDSSTRGGGIAMLFKTPLKMHIRRNYDLVYSTFECVHITNSSYSVNFIVVYRPPPSPMNGFTNADFLSEFDDLWHRN